MGEDYQPIDTLRSTLKAGLYTGLGGLFLTTIKASLTRAPIGAFAALRKHGATTAVSGGMGAAYMFAKSATANLRENDDATSASVGGLFAGAVLGLRFGTLPAVVGYGSALAATLGTFTYLGGRLRGFPAFGDEMANKQAMRLNRRRPVEETVRELGEGRGIYGPGYEERRAQRLKDAYGVSVPTTQS
ncbi:NADH-ubiquinone oxidoreductase 213 kDa subunit [Piedraia hortae CBS 480.64]|uniref:NADH-ubiquinone oxidoreductase 213 kDa subunit n=1 Tax=Piedraia hortae CBS 480.64 TaxID=1314780 RepID=A0A6A7BXZ0_9PEZI|nr:NADH-ubiquinone oxidoreductase 213 kDa subunit [Piedraia hortae CBS 480.64]